MADSDDAQRRSRRERQYEIDRITAEYVAELRAGSAPKIEDYVRRYPRYTRELLEFAVYFQTVGVDAVEPDAAPAAELSPAAEKALARIRERRTAASIAAIEGLVKQGAKVGYAPRQLAEAVGLTTDLLARLEARAIAIGTIPPTLVGRLAGALQVGSEAIAAYLGTGGAGQAGAFYYAERQPAQGQQSFLDAVQASALSPELKREWAEIVRQETGGGA